MAMARAARSVNIVERVEEEEESRGETSIREEKRAVVLPLFLLLMPSIKQDEEWDIEAGYDGWE